MRAERSDGAGARPVALAAPGAKSARRSGGGPRLLSMCRPVRVRSRRGGAAVSIEDHDLHDDLARVAEQLHQTAELIHASDGWWAADDGVDAVHSIVRSSAHASRALAGWYDRCSQRIFDECLGAEQDATKPVAAAERALRAFAAKLEALAERHGGLSRRGRSSRSPRRVRARRRRARRVRRGLRCARDHGADRGAGVTWPVRARGRRARRGPCAGTRWLCRHALPHRRGHVRHARQTRRAVAGGRRRSRTHPSKTRCPVSGCESNREIESLNRARHPESWPR